jgi:hypothetical protein
MERIRMNDITKKLQSLVKNRKTPPVVIKKGTVKVNTSASSSSGDSYSSYEEG